DHDPDGLQPRHDQHCPVPPHPDHPPLHGWVEQHVGLSTDHVSATCGVLALTVTYPSGPRLAPVRRCLAAGTADAAIVPHSPHRSSGDTREPTTMIADDRPVRAADPVRRGSGLRRRGPAVAGATSARAGTGTLVDSRWPGGGR